MTGELDLERFSNVGHVRRDLETWLKVVEMLDNGEMPPEDEPQPSTEERQALIDWARQFADAEARANAGDPGQVVLRRLGNAEYNHTVRDLTGGEDATNSLASLLNMCGSMRWKRLRGRR